MRFSLSAAMLATCLIALQCTVSSANESIPVSQPSFEDSASSAPNGKSGTDASSSNGLGVAESSTAASSPQGTPGAAAAPVIPALQAESDTLGVSVGQSDSKGTGGTRSAQSTSDDKFSNDNGTGKSRTETDDEARGSETSPEKGSSASSTGTGSSTGDSGVGGTTQTSTYDNTRTVITTSKSVTDDSKAKTVLTTGAGGKTSLTTTTTMAVDVEPQQNDNEFSTAPVTHLVKSTKTAVRQTPEDKKNDGSSSIALVLSFKTLITLAVMDVAPVY